MLRCLPGLILFLDLADLILLPRCLFRIPTWPTSSLLQCWEAIFGRCVRHSHPGCMGGS